MEKSKCHKPKAFCGALFRRSASIYSFALTNTRIIMTLTTFTIGRAVSGGAPAAAHHSKYARHTDFF